VETDEMKSPWSTVWYDPNGTIRTILEKYPQRHYRLLISLGGIAQILSAAAAMSMGDKMNLTQIILMALLFGPLTGWLTIILRSWFLTWVGHKLDGKANSAENRLCLAWSWVPIVYFLPLWGVKFMLFKNETFLLVRPVMENVPALVGLFNFFEFFDFVMYGWSLYILIRMLSEVNQFSGVRAIMNVILSGLLMAIPLLLLLYATAPFMKT
jgi:hypothetical protein